MSKFDKIEVRGGNNQFGDNNTQNNVINNNHHHNNSAKNNSGDEIIPIIIGSAAGLAALVWWFFSHIDQVYYYLNILTLSSGTLSFFAAFILFLSGSLTKEDVLRFASSTLYALGLFGLALLARHHAPPDVIQLSEQVKFMGFWQGLTDHGKDLVVVNFLAAIVVGIAALFVHLGAIRQFTYSLARPDRTGFFYELFSLTSLFRMRVVTVVVSISSGIVWAAINGMLPSINA